MKSNPQTKPINRAWHLLAIGFAALLTVSPALGQSGDSDALRKLQEENAALRRRLAALEGAQAPAPAATQEQAPSAPLVTAPAVSDFDEEVLVLSPFEVQGENDYGYLKTNSVTATRIGMAIQDIPMSISVISSEFIKDTNARDLMDLFRYSSAASGDTRFKMRVPANERTAQGAFTLRGFGVKSIMRNGVFRYISSNFDNIERVEMVKGPASVFFGQSYPGGVINFITKRPSFIDIPTDFTWQVNSNGGNRITFDHNAKLSNNVAFRVVGGWEDTEGERRYEYNKMFTFNPSLIIDPFKNRKVRMIFEVEHSQVRYNRNDYDWIYSDFAGWKDAAKNGTYGSSTATLSSTIAANAGNGLAANVVQTTTTPTLAYSTYINNKRNATGDLTLPAYTKVERGAYYTNSAGVFGRDEDFNYTSRGAYSDEDNSVISATLEASPFEWLDARYVYTFDNANHNSVGQGGAVTTPYADGIHFNMAQGNRSGYWRETQQHNLDLIFKLDFMGTKNKLLTGYQNVVWLQQYLGNSGVSDVNWAFLPGARNTTSNPDYALTNRGKYDLGNIPVNQVIYQRDGSIKPVRQIYSNFDPGYEIYPDINAWFNRDRTALDGYKPKYDSYYVNLQSTLLNDRLTILAGYRQEHRVEKYQYQENNAPWYIYPTDEYMWQDPVKYPENVWGHSINYQKTIPMDIKGDSWMVGASYAINDRLSVYGSVSSVFNFNYGIIGGHFPGDEELVANGIIAEMQAQGVTSVEYRGRQITTAQGFMDIWRDEMLYNTKIPNEEGMNYEFGAKISTKDQKLVGTFSFFRLNRANLKYDDGVATSNLGEPVNYSANPIFIGGVTRAIANGAVTPSGYNSATSSGRIFRVYNYGNDQQVEGFDGEVIWTPMRNFQAVINGSWMWSAQVIEDTRPPSAAPGSPGYATLTPVQKVASDILWGSRIANVPEFRFNFFGKYTFPDGIGGFGIGSNVGLGMRYSSKTVVSQSVDWNPLNGGYQAGDYLVFDLTAGIPWELFGTKIHTSVGIYNVTDEQYSEGSFVLAPARNWLLTNSIQF